MKLLILVARGMPDEHLQGLQWMGANVQGRIDTSGKLLAHISTSDVGLGRVALVDIEPPSLDMLAPA